jgi:hypothetical protein
MTSTTLVIVAPAIRLVETLTVPGLPQYQVARFAPTMMSVQVFQIFDAYTNSLQAKNLFLNHLATVDTSGGAVTTELIQFHLVPDMRKRFNKFVKVHGCT